MPASQAIQAELSQEESLATQGELFSFAGETTVAAGASYKIGFISPLNFTFIHSRWRTGADKARAFLHEDVAYTGGTVKAITNRNRQSARTLQCAAKIGVTATVGTPISAIIFGNKACGAAEIDEEFILKKNTPYVLELVNDANSQSDVIFWFIACCEYDLP